MILQNLDIGLEEWGDKKGQYTGKIKMKGEAGSITLNLNQDHIKKIIDIVAASLVEVAHNVAHNLTAECIQIGKEPEPVAIEAPAATPFEDGIPF